MDIFLIVYQLGICCCYIVFVGLNVKDVLDVYLSEPISVEVCMLICLIPFVLINLIRNLKLLAPFSSLANVLTFVSFGIILYYIFKGGLPEFGTLPSFGTLYTFPLFFGTTLFALEAVGVVSSYFYNHNKIVIFREFRQIYPWCWLRIGQSATNGGSTSNI